MIPSRSNAHFFMLSAINSIEEQSVSLEPLEFYLPDESVKPSASDSVSLDSIPSVTGKCLEVPLSEPVSGADVSSGDTGLISIPDQDMAADVSLLVETDGAHAKRYKYSEEQMVLSDGEPFRIVKLLDETQGPTGESARNPTEGYISRVALWRKRKRHTMMSALRRQIEWIIGEMGPKPFLDILDMHRVADLTEKPEDVREAIVNSKKVKLTDADIVEYNTIDPS